MSPGAAGRAFDGQGLRVGAVNHRLVFGTIPDGRDRRTL